MALAFGLSFSMGTWDLTRNILHLPRRDRTSGSPDRIGRTERKPGKAKAT
jgi:hypothetical protein